LTDATDGFKDFLQHKYHIQNNTRASYELHLAVHQQEKTTIYRFLIIGAIAAFLVILVKLATGQSLA